MPLSDEVLAEAVALVRQHGTVTAAAEAAGIHRRTLGCRIKRAAERGLMGFDPVLEGFRISKTTTVYDADGLVNRQFVQQKPEPGEAFAVPDGHVVKGVSAYLDADGRVTSQWVKTREGMDPLATIEAIKAAFAEWPLVAEPVPGPETADSDTLTLIPCNDWHIGMFAWGRETGENWDLKIAERTIGAAVEDLVARSPASSEAIVLGGGDLIHADSNDNRTVSSGNALQVDGRYPKVIGVACRLKVRTIDAALRQHGRVIVRILAGNHDPHASVAIAYFLLAWYRNEPRVTVDVDPSLFFWHRFGSVLLGATHGHSVKVSQMPAIMAHRRAEDWGATRFRYVHGFHLHHSAKIATEGEGVICEVHQAPVPQDAWHFGSGFLSGRSLQSITYHRDFGEIGRCRVAILASKDAA
jgi:hypothetical protein